MVEQAFDPPLGEFVSREVEVFEASRRGIEQEIEGAIVEEIVGKIEEPHLVDPGELTQGVDAPDSVPRMSQSQRAELRCVELSKMREESCRRERPPLDGQVRERERGEQRELVEEEVRT